MRAPAGRQWAQALFWVGLGAVPGALLRWALASTVLANTLGCWVVGASGLLGPTPPRRRWLVGIGFAGSLTTFSTWVLELLMHLQGGHWGALLGQVLRDGALGIGAMLLGAALHPLLEQGMDRLLRR